MNKPVTYALVNCGRVFEGTLRNLLPPAFLVKTLAKEDVDTSLCNGPAAFASRQNAAPANGSSVSIADAKEAVASMLADSAAGNSVETPSPPVTEKPMRNDRIDPDCILYQLTINADNDIYTVRKLRRICRFRDVPILIVTTYSELPRARSLISHGANEVVVFPCNPELLKKKVLSVLDPVGTRMPVITKVINPYISATVDLLGTMAGLHAEKKDVFLKKNYRLFGDISAIMSLTGKVEGQVVVCFEEKLAREVVANIMSSRPQDLTKDELKEGIGEVVNIVAGNAKAALSTTEYAHQIGLPTVVFGQGHELSHPGNAPCIVVIFEIEGQPLAVLVSMTITGSLVNK